MPGSQFLPLQVKWMFCPGRSPTFPSWLVKSCVCTAAPSAADCPVQKVSVEMWEHLCKAPPVSPPCSLPRQWQRCWIPASTLMCGETQLRIAGRRSKGENYFWCRFPQRKALFLEAGARQRGPCDCVSKNGPSPSFLCLRAVTA